MERFRRILIGLLWLTTCVPLAGAMVPEAGPQIAPVDGCCGPSCACTPVADCGCRMSPAPATPLPAPAPASLPGNPVLPDITAAHLPVSLAADLAAQATVHVMVSHLRLDRSPPGIDRLVLLRI